VALVAPAAACIPAANIRAGNPAIKKIQLLKNRARSIHTVVLRAVAARNVELKVKTK
jgi:hypothetical protein